MTFIYHKRPPGAFKTPSGFLKAFLVKAGVDIQQAQYLLGHDDIKTPLDTYTHFGYADVKLDKLESYYNAVKRQYNTPQTRINKGFPSFIKK